MKHTRRLISLLLVLALALAISPSAFAAGEDGEDAPPAETEPQEIVIEGKLTNGTMSFSTIKSALSKLVGGNAYYASNLSVAPAQGTLYLGYLSEANRGAGVATTQILYFNSTNYESVDNVTFVPNPNYIGDAEITFSVYSSDGGSPVTGTIKVKVEQQEAALSYSSNGDLIRFQAEDFSAWCLSVTGRSISSVTFTLPLARNGTMYYNYIDENIYDSLVDTGTQYFRTGLPAIDNITLIPAEGYSGSFYINFSGLDSAGVTVHGRVRISVSGGAPSSGSDLSYAVTAGQRLTFRAADFSNACYNETGFDLNYLRFTSLPSSSRGTLYYNNTTAVQTSDAYYYSDSSQRLIEDVSFIAGGGYDGAITIPFTGYSTGGTTFSGIVVIEVSGSGSVNFSYTVKAGQRVYIGAAGAAEISAACAETTGAPLSYVNFPTLPDASHGILYHNGTMATVTESYYAPGSGSDKLLQNINFLADENYEGTFSIPFTACSARGTSFNGVLRIEVTNAGASAIRYTVVAGQRIKLRADDFADICSQKTGYSLNYVRFTSLPAASSGVFYENNTTNVTTSTNYYHSGGTSTGTNTHLLENISFAANADYSGTFTVDYTCYSSGGRNYTGTLYVTVTAASTSQTSPITYYTTGPAARFSASDFSSATSSSLSGSLASVRFDALNTSAGQMYYAYISPASHSTFVPGQSYSTSQLSQLYFLPRAGFSGTANISYTATDDSGNTAAGTVLVSVTPPLVSSYFDDMGHSSWAVPAVDFLRNYQIVSGVSATQYAPSENMIRGDFILMLSQAYGFYSAGTGSFPDVPQNSYYAAAIASARMMGIASGDTSGRFHPKDPITRQDAAVLLHRCMGLYGKNLTATESALFGFPDSGSIAPYAIDAMAALVHFGVFQGDDHGLLRPTATLTRAEMASVLHRALTY